MGLIVVIVWKWSLGEHDGSGNVQGFDKRMKGGVWEEECENFEYELNLLQMGG